jgi:two-component system osmolarity sensor histidine kinase EnvZ
MQDMYSMPTTRKRHRRRLGLKRFLPTNLFARALLILILPMLLLQLVMAHIFFDRHWKSVERNMANSAVGDFVWLYETYQKELETHDREAAIISTQALGRQLGVQVSAEEGRALKIRNGEGKRQFPDLFKTLDQRFESPVAIRLNNETNMVRVRVGVEGGALDLLVNRKALTSPTTKIFMLWMVGSSILLTVIATLFLRNQVRPIVQLARVAEQLGLGQDVTGFKPKGASEVRRAGRAFLMMSERIRRHVQSRTEMLAGISHDLRTPLTRMKLELELATIDAVTRKALSDDIDEMGVMIDEYLDFARGDAGEIAIAVDVNWLLTDIAKDYGRSGRDVRYRAGEVVELNLRPQAMRRALTNLIDNALRYGGEQVQLGLELSTTFVRIKVMDSGPGIPDARMEEVFKPFTRLEPSRNSETGGVGLGLSIARAVVQSHGGDVTLENIKDSVGRISGLEVTLRVPRAVQPTQ